MEGIPRILTSYFLKNPTNAAQPIFDDYSKKNGKSINILKEK